MERGYSPTRYHSPNAEGGGGANAEVGNKYTLPDGSSTDLKGLIKYHRRDVIPEVEAADIKEILERNARTPSNAQCRPTKFKWKPRKQTY